MKKAKVEINFWLSFILSQVLLEKYKSHKFCVWEKTEKSSTLL